MIKIKIGDYYRNKTNGQIYKVIEIDDRFVYFDTKTGRSRFCSKEAFLNYYRLINTKLEKVLLDIE